MSVTEEQLRKAFEEVNARLLTLTEQMAKQQVDSAAALTRLQTESGTAMANLRAEHQAEMSAVQAASTGRGDSGLIDSRVIGKPETFSGEHAKWKDWSVKFRSYAAAHNERLGKRLKEVEELTEKVLNAAQTPEDARASISLYYILVMVTAGVALDLVVNSGEQQGLEAWRRLVNRFEPRVRSRYAGLLLEILSSTFSGDIVSRIEAFERQIAEYQKNSSETVSDGIRIGIVLRNMDEGPVRQHLLMNAERLKLWQDFREEIVNIRRAQLTSTGTVGAGGMGAAPMELGQLGSFDRGGQSGGYQRKQNDKGDIVCHNCGRKGHKKPDCWAKGGGAYDPNWKPGQGGQKKKGEGKGKGKGGGGKAQGGKQKKCGTCGKEGHLSKDCPNKKTLSGLDGAPSTAADGAADDLKLNGLFLNSLKLEKKLAEVGVGAETIGRLRELGAFEDAARTLTIGIDSGAAVTVIPADVCQDYPLIPNEATRQLTEARCLIWVLGRSWLRPRRAKFGDSRRGSAR